MGSFLLLISISFFGAFRRLQILILAGSAFILALHVIIEIFRWHSVFCLFVFIISSLLILRSSISYLFFRVVGFILGSLLIGTSALYMVTMPIKDLPAPMGSYDVGLRSLVLKDSLRDERLTDQSGDSRELFIQIWHPAELDKNENLQRSTMWAELYKGKSDAISFLTSYMRGIHTNSYPNVAIANDQERYPLILFNHGLQMFSEQNTLLMEHFASNGFVVVSIGHPYESLRVNISTGTVLPEFVTSWENFQKGLSWIENSSRPIQQARDSIENISDIEIRAHIMLEAIRDSPMNEIVSYWEQDNRFVLDAILGNQLTNISDIQLKLDEDRIGAIGMSIGGAVTTELSKSDDRIKAAINVDGLQYGNRNYDSLKVPFMMIYSQDGVDNNEFLKLRSTHDYYELTFQSAKHADFTDLPMVWPVLGIYGQLGSIPSQKVISLTNRVILDFFQYYLADNQQGIEFLVEDMKEVEVEFIPK